MSVIAQWMPAALSAEDWAGRRDEVGDLVVRDAGDRGARASRSRVRARQVLTPADLEAEYGLTGGHPLHGGARAGPFFLWRPLLGWARYRMPVDGLYLAGPGRTRAAA